MTSAPAGRVVPVAAFPLLREDAMRSFSLRINTEMMETAEIIMNPVHCKVQVWVVPYLAFDRFEDSMDQFNRSYAGVAQIDGGVVKPFFETAVAGAPGFSNILKYLGLHVKQGDTYNTAYIEAYNEIWNYRAKQRSPKITKRGRLDLGLAFAFWNHSRYQHMVPDFDQKEMEGAIPISFLSNQIAIKGLNTGPAASAAGTTHTTNNLGTNVAAIANTFYPVFAEKTVAGQAAKVYAEMIDGGITLSLANIELAKQMKSWAGLRKMFNQHDDAWVISLLMDGIGIPDQNLKDPLLLKSVTRPFGMQKRYATDAANLSEGATNGATFIDLDVSLPRLNTGGVVMVTIENVPEQLWERERDNLLYQTDTASLPEAMRDALDPEKVELVPNGYMDVSHSAPTGLFAYAPNNHKWEELAARIGGKYFRPTVDAAFDEERQRFWAVETANPQLADDFFVCRTIHQKPFLNTTADPFEVVALGNAVIEGNTVFGPALIEANPAGSDYDAVRTEVPMTRITKA